MFVTSVDHQSEPPGCVRYTCAYPCVDGFASSSLTCWPLPRTVLWPPDAEMEEAVLKEVKDALHAAEGALSFAKENIAQAEGLVEERSIAKGKAQAKVAEAEMTLAKHVATVKDLAARLRTLETARDICIR